MLDLHNTMLSTSVVLFGDETLDELKIYILGLKRIGISGAGFGYQTDTELRPESISAVATLFHFLFRLRLLEQGNISLHGDILESVELHLAGQDSVGPCDCGTASITIEPDGSFAPGLCMDYRPGTPAAPSAFNVMQLQRAKALRASDPCANCSLWGVCHGGCVTRSRALATPFLRDAVHCSILLDVAARVNLDLIAAGVAPDRARTEA